MLAKEGMQRVFYGSNGSDATETALKLARQYWKIAGQAERTKFIALKQGYHGSHFASAALNGNAVFRRSYEPNMPGCFHVENPSVYRNPFTTDPEELGRICAMLLEREIEFQGPATVAAFIAEPVQGAGGVIVPPANYWPMVRAVCDKYGVLLIADEVVTGFGRTGNLFGSRGWGVKPDIMCFAKGITSGYIPLSATALNARVAQAFDHSADASGAIMHGYVFRPSRRLRRRAREPENRDRGRIAGQRGKTRRLPADGAAILRRPIRGYRRGARQGVDAGHRSGQ